MRFEGPESVVKWRMPPLRGCWITWAAAVLVLLAPSSTNSQDLEPKPDTAVYHPQCRDGLGMHSGVIPDSAITASSSYDLNSVGPQNSRIRTERNGGAWCPKKQINRSVYEFIQIDLGGLKVITSVETQGRFGNGQGQEFAEYYMLEYQRAEEGPWVRYKNKQGNEIFRGNSNTYTVEMREVDPPIVARRLRFVPHSRHPRTVCMRVEAYGCPRKDGLLSYDMPEGDKRGAEVYMSDFTYDGKTENGHSSGGLGQLTDWEEGITNFRLDRHSIGKKGYEWVGWKNETGNHKPVEIIFTFDSVRNFSSINLHCNNMFTKDIRIFRKAKVYFSNGGKYYSGEPVVMEYLRDSLIEFARTVNIPIPHRIGKYLKLELYFDSRWIMVSEIKFQSEPVQGNITVEAAPESPVETAVVPSPPGTEKKPPIRVVVKTDHKYTTTNELPEDGAVPTERRDKPRQSNTQTVPPRKNAERKPGDFEVFTPTNGRPHSHEPRSNNEKALKEEHIGMIIGALAAMILILFAVAVFIVLRNQRKKHEEEAYDVYEKHRMTQDTDEIKAPVGSTLPPSYHSYNKIAVSDVEYDSDSMKKPRVNEAYLQPNDIGSSQRSLRHDGTGFSGEPALYVKLPPDPVYRLPTMGGSTPPISPPPPIPPHPHAAALVPINTASAAPTSTTGAGDLNGNQYANSMINKRNGVWELPHNSLKFVEKLGEGQFGEVHLCELQLGRLMQSASVPVAVKVLSRPADKNSKDRFQQEASVLSEIRDPNVAQVIGVCRDVEPMCMVLEYTQHGDLKNFLQSHVPEQAAECGTGQRVLSYGAQIYMATQITSGMKYLESLNMVHRDLAARNCLVDELYTIKISDLGMSRTDYMQDYYRVEGRTMLPIRWMAWESIMLGKFSSKSDIWSFAVTLWEILSFAREQPFAEFSDEQIVTNANHFFKGDGQHLYLPQPIDCPKEIYDLMCECWNREEAQRPAFREIHMFLQRKNMGFDPREDMDATNPTLV